MLRITGFKQLHYGPASVGLPGIPVGATYDQRSEVDCRENLGLPRGHGSLPPCPQHLVPVTTFSSVLQSRAEQAKHTLGAILRDAWVPSGAGGGAEVVTHDHTSLTSFPQHPADRITSPVKS